MDFTAVRTLCSPGSIRCQRSGARWHVSFDTRLESFDGVAVVIFLLIYCVVTRDRVREIHDTKDRNTRLDFGKRATRFMAFFCFWMDPPPLLSGSAAGNGATSNVESICTCLNFPLARKHVSLADIQYQPLVRLSSNRWTTGHGRTAMVSEHLEVCTYQNPVEHNAVLALPTRPPTRLPQ